MDKDSGRFDAALAEVTTAFRACAGVSPTLARAASVDPDLVRRDLVDPSSATASDIAALLGQPVFFDVIGEASGVDEAGLPALGEAIVAAMREARRPLWQLVAGGQAGRPAPPMVVAQGDPYWDARTQFDGVVLISPLNNARHARAVQAHRALSAVLPADLLDSIMAVREGPLGARTLVHEFAHEAVVNPSKRVAGENIDLDDRVVARVMAALRARGVADLEKVGGIGRGADGIFPLWNEADGWTNRHIASPTGISALEEARAALVTNAVCAGPAARRVTAALLWAGLSEEEERLHATVVPSAYAQLAWVLDEVLGLDFDPSATLERLGRPLGHAWWTIVFDAVRDRFGDMRAEHFLDVAFGSGGDLPPEERQSCPVIAALFAASLDLDLPPLEAVLMKFR